MHAKAISSAVADGGLFIFLGQESFLEDGEGHVFKNSLEKEPF